MVRALIGAALLAACGLAACGQGAEPAKEAAKEEAPVAAATNLKDQAAALGPAELAMLAIEQVKSAPGGPRPCERIRNTQDMGVVPADALTGSTFAAHVGARAYVVHCDPVGVEMKMDGTGQWLIYMPPDSMNAVVEPCVQPGRANVCFRDIPKNPA